MMSYVYRCGKNGVRFILYGTQQSMWVVIGEVLTQGDLHIRISLLRGFCFLSFVVRVLVVFI